MFKRILFMGRKNDKYSKLLASDLKKLTKNIKIFYSKKSNEKINKKLFNVPKFWYDYIICFKSYYILSKSEINKSKFASINFHPGPPEYRGIGCINYALYDNIKTYGVTAHLMSKKIDSGKIIDVKKIKILKTDNLDSLLKKTHFTQYIQAKKIIKLLYKNDNNLKNLIFKSKKKKWSKSIKSRKDLNKFYEINKNIKKDELKRKIRATFTKKYKPYLIINNKKIIMKNQNFINKYFPISKL